MKLAWNSRLTLGLCFVLALVLLQSFRLNNGDNISTVISSDGSGYYAYLPAIFIDHNLDDLPFDPSYTNDVGERRVNKYFVGTSILLSPFFAIGHASAWIFGQEMNGFSATYQIMVALAAVFYLFLGLIFLRKLLQLYDISDHNISIVLAAVFLGTNLMYYSIIAGSMAHVYAFSMISCFAYLVKKILLTQQFKYLYWGSAVYALIVLIRPTDGIVILLPFVLAPSLKELKQIVIHLFKQPKKVALVFLIFGFFIFLQTCTWYVQTGQFIIWSYSQEGFYFSNPQLYNVLLSFKKGLFIYTPLTLLASFGLIAVFRKNKFQFVSIFLFLLLATYIISSWWSWYYGDSFGLRAFIDYYAVYALLLAFMLERSKQLFKRISFYILTTICVLLNLVQSYQYYNLILHPCYMNFEKYQYVFLKTSDDYVNVLGGWECIAPYSKKPLELVDSTFNDFEAPVNGWNNGYVSRNQICEQVTEWSNYSAYSGTEYGLLYTAETKPSFFETRKLWMKVSFRKLDLKQNGSDGAFLVVDVRDTLQNIRSYQSIKINNTPLTESCKWKDYSFTILVLPLETIEDNLSVYIWNTKKEDFLIDDFKIELYAIPDSSPPK